MQDIQILDLTRKPRFRVRLPSGALHDLGPFDMAALQMLEAIRAAQESVTMTLAEKAAPLTDLVAHLLPTADRAEVERLDAPEMWQIVNTASQSALKMVEALKNGGAPVALSTPAPATTRRSRPKTSRATSLPG